MALEIDRVGAISIGMTSLFNRIVQSDSARQLSFTLAGTCGLQPYDFFFRIAKYMSVVG
jgi:hypothetical protein